MVLKEINFFKPKKASQENESLPKQLENTNTNFSSHDLKIFLQRSVFPRDLRKPDIFPIHRNKVKTKVIFHLVFFPLSL